MDRIQTKSFSLAAYIKGDKHAKKRALVLPGYLDTKDYNHLRSLVDMLANNGYLAASVDFPGTWGSDQDSSEYTYTNCLKAMYELIEVCGGPITLIGHSNGGRLALQVASETPAVNAVVAIMAPLYIRRSTSKKESVVKWKTEGTRHYQMPLPNNSGKFREFTIPFSYIEDSEKHPLKPLLAEVHVPKLFIAGNEDHIIPTTEVEKAYECAAEPKSYRLVQAPHIYYNDQKAVVAVNETVREFLISK